MDRTLARVGCGVLAAQLFAILNMPGDAVGAAGFHEGGVASCGGCHVMHESVDGQLVIASEDLLLAESSTDVCLGCHASINGGVFANGPLDPVPERGGGNFVFLLEDELNDGVTGGQFSIGGEAAGHSIVAPSVGLAAESRWLQAPGGNFPSSILGCTSCHDPHGNANFRMLHGAGPVQGGLFYFSRPASLADGIALDGPPESRYNHTAYRSGWSAWCGNCHDEQYHDRDVSNFEHEGSHGLDSDERDRYGVYAGDNDPTGGTPALSYLPELPFEDPNATVSSQAGPSGSSRLACISCHRAHASSSPAAGRWDFRVKTLGDDGVRSGSYPIPNPYLDPNQRVLCVKCHDPEGHDRGMNCLTCHANPGGRDSVEPPLLLEQQ